LLMKKMVCDLVDSFSPNPFAKTEIAEDLIVRVDQARARRAR
jgi:hypothetical protein